MGKKVDALEDVWRTHDIHDVIGTRRKVVLCPLPQHIHHNNTPSFSVFWRDKKQWWRCHGSCDMEGDVIDLVGYLNISGYKRYNMTMRFEAASILDKNFHMAVVIPQKETRLRGSEWLDFLPMSDETLAYAKTRGLTQKTLTKFRVGTHSNYMTMPCFEDDLLVGIKLRNTQPDGQRFWQWIGSRQGLFNIDAVRYRLETIFVVKGEIPCMLLDQLGYLAVAPTGGEGGWRESWRTALALGHCVVIGDNDAPGKLLARRRALLLGAEEVYPPEAFKDWDEWYLADPTGCVSQTDKWKESE